MCPQAVRGRGTQDHPRPAGAALPQQQRRLFFFAMLERRLQQVRKYARKPLRGAIGNF